MVVRECLGGSWAGRCLPVYLLIALMVACGCARTGQPSPPLASVSGTVTLDGQLLPDGFVTFVSPQQGLFEAFPIKEGRYTGKAGLGTRRVEIIAVREEQPSQTTSRAEEPPRPQRENYLPAKYSTKSTLTAEVTRDGPNVFDFDLTMGK